MSESLVARDATSDAPRGNIVNSSFVRHLSRTQASLCSQLNLNFSRKKSLQQSLCFFKKQKQTVDRINLRSFISWVPADTQTKIISSIVMHRINPIVGVTTHIMHKWIQGLMCRDPIPKIFQTVGKTNLQMICVSLMMQIRECA